MTNFNAALDAALAIGDFREKGIVLTVGSNRGEDSLRMYVQVFQRHFSWVKVVETPPQFLQSVREEKPAYFFVEDRFFETSQEMIKQCAVAVKAYDQLPYILFLCAESIQFISGLIKNKIPGLKTSAIFHKPLRSVALHAYLLGLAHQNKEKEQGVGKTPLGELVEKYKKALINNNPAPLEAMIAF